jgi:hypothetical protein
MMMSYKIFLFLTFVLFSSFDNGQTNPVKVSNDWKKMGLKGRVKSVTEEQCSVVKRSRATTSCKIKQKTVFNSDGYKVEEQIWEFSQLRKRRVYAYSNENVLSRIECLGRDNSVITTYLFEYDQSGNITEEKIFSGNNLADSRYTYLYDEKGQKIQMDGYNMKTGGNHFIKEVFKYDNFGNPIKETSEHASGNSITDFSYKYDNEKKIVEKMEKTTYEKLGKYSTTIRYKYDSKNNVVEEYKIHNGRSSTTVIRVDKTGNWVKRTTTESKDTFLTTERILEYF